MNFPPYFMFCCSVKDPMCPAHLALRLSFGISLLLVGIAHYMNLDGLLGMSSEGLGPLALLGTIWAYILPALQIVGGALFAIGMYYGVASWLVGIALGSIPVGMILQTVLTGAPLDQMMSVAINTFIWLIVYYLVVKSCACCGSCDKKES